MKETNENIKMSQEEKDSKFLLETYGNKKAVDAACKKSSILDFVSKDDSRRFMQGIFYEDGFAIATDGRVLIKQKTSYPSEFEGKIIDPANGKEIEGHFPNYKNVFPAKENLVDRSYRLAHISDYLASATTAAAISPKDYNVPVMFENTFVNARYLQTALAFAREKGFNKVYQEDNYKLIDIPELDENGKEVYKFYNYDEPSDDNYRHKYYSFEELPDKVKKLVSLHMRPMQLCANGVTDSAVRRLLFDAGEYIDDLMIICNADITSHNKGKVDAYRDNYKLLIQRMKELEESDHLRNFQPPVDGNEIMEMFNLTPCREVGILKELVKNAILDGLIPNEHDKAKEFIIKQYEILHK